MNEEIHKPKYDMNQLRELSKDFSVNNVLKHHAYQNKPLGFEDAYVLGVYTLYPYKEELEGIFDVDPVLAEKQSIAALCALHNKETYKDEKAAGQIAGITAAVFDYDIGLSTNGFLNLDIGCVMDNCGMGGDLYRTSNVSTLAALIASADGIPMGKHGSPGNTDSTGSSDFLEYLGVDLFSKPEVVEEALRRFNFGYTDALDTDYKSVHVQTHKSAHLAHMNDIIGPITNPLNPAMVKKRVLGVNHLIEPSIVAKAYNILNKEGITSLDHGLFIRGYVDSERNGGIDEASVFEGGTKVAELKDGVVDEYSLFADDFGIDTPSYVEPPRGKIGKAQFSKEILEGKVSGVHKDLVLANAAILQYLDKGIGFREGFKRSKDILESGEPFRNLENYISFTRGEVK
ncbi:hypothetical protein GOV05_01380 [Candidatus Woesearchaeota archaeon]|nr:hypothetical protein [Candidatus Woesearchaeota archaeon]